MTPTASPYAERTSSASVAANVRAELARRRLRRADVAATAGLSLTALSRRLNGRAPFTVDELYAIADALGVSPSTLMSNAA